MGGICIFGVEVFGCERFLGVGGICIRGGVVVLGVE